jgi:AAA+ ATPase superfamily predicted ATPase
MPGLGLEDQIRAFATFGGMPYYLVDLIDAGSIRQAILDQILAPGAKLRDEPTFLFAQESKIRDADRYRSIVRAVTRGDTAPNEVAQRTGIERSNLNHYLDLLYEMEILAKRFPVTEQGAARSFRLEVTDPFLRFWFTFVGPYESRLIDFDRAERHLDDTVMPGLDDFVSIPAFEEICREWTVDNFSNVASIGSWWGSVKERTPEGPRNIQREVDVAGIDADGKPIILGSCKWTNSQHPHAELAKLERVREILKCPEAKLLFFSRSGADPKLTKAAKADPTIKIVDLPDLR